MNDAADSWRERGLRDAALAGDGTAWRALFDGAFDAVSDYTRWRAGGCADLADDAVQEAWLTAARTLTSFDPGRGRFAGWVCGIAANVLRNHLRSRRRLGRRTRPLGDVAAPADGAAEQREKAERVATALAELPARYEQVLRAKYLDRQTVDAIAAGRGETAKAVESLLSRAREAFREVYGKLEVGE